MVWNCHPCSMLSIKFLFYASRFNAEYIYWYLFSCIFLVNIRSATKSKTAHFPWYFRVDFFPFQAGFVLQPRQSSLIISAYFLYLPFTDTMEIIEESKPFLFKCYKKLFYVNAQSAGHSSSFTSVSFLPFESYDTPK